jgi:hypothetical protein
MAHGTTCRYTWLQTKNSDPAPNIENTSKWVNLSISRLVKQFVLQANGFPIISKDFKVLKLNLGGHLIPMSFYLWRLVSTNSALPFSAAAARSVHDKDKNQSSSIGILHEDVVTGFLVPGSYAKDIYSCRIPSERYRSKAVMKPWNERLVK